MCHMVHVDQTIKDKLDAIEIANMEVGRLLANIKTARDEVFLLINDLQMNIREREGVIDRDFQAEMEEREVGHV